MFSQRFTTLSPAAFAASLAFLAPIELNISTASADEPTTIEDLVVYGVPQGSQELFRYDFGSDTFSTLGVVIDQYGRTVKDLKSLAYIPSGPDKGLYGASEEDPFLDYLIKIDPLTADATLSTLPGGWTNKLSGMVAIQSGGVWLLLATDQNKNLFTIVPATGVATYLCTLTESYQGLAVDADGLVFGTTGGGQLWAIDLADRISGDVSAEWMVGLHGNGGIEALEFAFGMDEARVDALGLDDEWVENGLLLTYGQGSGLLIVNPETGAAIPYPTSIPSLDLEGLVFLPAALDVWVNLPTADIIYD